MSEEQAAYNIKPISLDQREEIQKSLKNCPPFPWRWIDDRTCLMPEGFADYGDYILFVQKSAGVEESNAHLIAKAPEYISLLLSSEQAWREETLKWKRALESHGPEGHNYTNAEYVRLLQERKEFKDQLNQAKEERDSYQRVGIRTMEQLNQAVEVLKHYGKDPITGNHARFTLQQLGIEATQSSLSQEGDKERITLRPEVQWFAEQMELVLKENDYKGGWKDGSVDWLIERLYQEAKELWDEIERTKRFWSDPNNSQQRKLVIKEAVDVADFAMMIADNARLSQGTEGSHDRT